MFTGLVAEKGRLCRRSPRGTRFTLEVETHLGPFELGESIAVNGACLTVTASGARSFSADVSVETNERTTLGELTVTSEVNLERALSVGDRLGGHLVTGHVDGVARVRDVSRDGDTLRVSVEAPPELRRFIAEKGSVALDGVSLTVNRVQGSLFEVMLIPHTLSVTTLGGIEPGRRSNLEVDLVARYVVRYFEATAAEAGHGLEATLKRAGFLG